MAVLSTGDEPNAGERHLEGYGEVHVFIRVATPAERWTWHQSWIHAEIALVIMGEEAGPPNIGFMPLDEALAWVDEMKQYLLKVREEGLPAPLTDEQAREAELLEDEE